MTNTFDAVVTWYSCDTSPSYGRWEAVCQAFPKIAGYGRTYRKALTDLDEKTTRVLRTGGAYHDVTELH